MLNQKLLDEEFGWLKDVIFLNAAYVVAPPLRTQTAWHSFMDDYIKTFSEDCVAHGQKIVEECRDELAKLIHCDRSEIAFVKNTSEGVGIITNGYPFQKGDNVIVADLEHTSNLYGWLKLQDKGIELRVVKSHDGSFSLDDMVALMDENTKAVGISTVQFSTGFRVDLNRLGEECKKRNILLCVDGIQSLGRLEMDVKKLNIAYLSAGGNKGLLATLGVGFVYCSKDIIKKIIPPYASYQAVVNRVKPPAVTTDFSKLEWHDDARRLEAGNANYAGVAALKAGVSLLNEIGVPAIEQHVLALDKRLREKIKGIGLKVVTPTTEANYSGVICVYYPPEHEKEVIEILHRRKIYTTMRGGYIRVALHLYNTEKHIDETAAALWEINNLK